MKKAVPSSRAKLIQGVFRGNHRAIARAISMVEDDGRQARHLMKKIFRRRKESLILGVTGAPGTGKSTLVDQMTGCLRKEGKTVGIVAVDPSSPFSGGAILGDRIRMMRHSLDPGVFIRSMATRGHLGGLAKATGEAIAVLEAAGKSHILVETVGVGQDEVEVVKLADIVLVVLSPGAGDEIQAFKAGIMEIGDIFVLNKADHPEAEKTERQLRAMLELGLQQKDIPPIVKTVATRGVGLDVLREEIRTMTLRRKSFLKDEKKKKLIAWMLQDIMKEKVVSVLNRHVRESEYEEFVEKILKRETDPYSVADKLVARLKIK